MPRKPTRRSYPIGSPHCSPEWATVHGYHYVKANYLLLIDNLARPHAPRVRPSNDARGQRGRPTGWRSSRFGPKCETVRTRRGDARRGTVRAGAGDQALCRRAGIDRFQTSWSLACRRMCLFRSVPKQTGTRDEMEFPHHIVPNNITPETETTTVLFLVGVAPLRAGR